MKHWFSRAPEAQEQAANGLQFSAAAAELALRYGVVLTLSHIGAALLAAASLWNAVPAPSRNLWLAWAGLAAIAHAGAVWWSRHRHGGRYVWFVAGVGAVASAWGAAGVLLYSAAPLYQAVLVVLVFAVAAVALLVLAAFARLYALYLLISVSPLLLRLAADGDAPHAVIATSGAVLAAALGVLAYTVRGTLRSWFALRARNQALVDDLRLQKETAEQANVAKSKFLAAASHDLRQPLHALSLFSAALSDRIRYPEVRRIVDNIMASVAALESLFNSLLDISKLDAGALQPQWSAVALRQILDRLDNDYRPQAEAKGLELHVQSLDDVHVRSDAALLERMLRNLVANAIRYSNAGSVTVTVEVAGARAMVAVRDTGVGIAESDLGTIFDEYVQLQNPERDRNKGLGLGLAIVQRLSHMLDHPVTVDSVPGEGSVFAISVPLAQPHSAPIDTREPGAQTSLAGLSVLVIDDDDANREATMTLLQGWGCRVRSVADGEGALRVLREWGAVDCVIADYRLRAGSTGVQVIEALESASAPPPAALILTGDSGLAQQGRIGAQGYRLMQKPAKPARLRAFLGYAARRRSQPTTL